MLALDGVYAADRDGRPRFHALPAPEDDEVAAVGGRIAERVRRLLERRGLGPDADPEEVDSLARDEPLPASLYSAPVKRPWPNGATHVIFDPLESLEKLAALVPPPRFHMVRNHWVLAPAAKWRSEIVPRAHDPARDDVCAHLENDGASDHQSVSHSIFEGILSAHRSLRHVRFLRHARYPLAPAHMQSRRQALQPHTQRSVVTDARPPSFMPELVPVDRKRSQFPGITVTSCRLTVPFSIRTVLARLSKRARNSPFIQELRSNSSHASIPYSPGGIWRKENTPD